MKFLSIETDHHILRPIGYGLVEKYVKRGAPVRSAAEQFTIQLDATQFESHILYVPKPVAFERRSYTMPMISKGFYVPSQYYSTCKPLLYEIVRFIGFMLKRHYFLHSFTIIYDTIQERFALLDFSRCGFIQGTAVRFPRDDNTYSIDEADTKYGFPIDMNLLYDCT